MNTGFDHIAEHTLEEWVLDRRPGEQYAGLEEHLLICRICQDRVKNIDEYVAVMKSAFFAIAARASEHSAA